METKTKSSVRERGRDMQCTELYLTIKVLRQAHYPSLAVLIPFILCTALRRQQKIVESKPDLENYKGHTCSVIRTGHRTQVPKDEIRWQSKVAQARSDQSQEQHMLSDLIMALNCGAERQALRAKKVEVN